MSNFAKAAPEWKLDSASTLFDARTDGAAKTTKHEQSTRTADAEYPRKRHYNAIDPLDATISTIPKRAQFYSQYEFLIGLAVASLSMLLVIQILPN